MIHKRADHSLIYNNGFIYAVGSFAKNVFKAHCEKYSVAEDKWYSIPSMNKSRSGVGLTAFNQKNIFAFGG